MGSILYTRFHVPPMLVNHYVFLWCFFEKSDAGITNLYPDWGESSYLLHIFEVWYVNFQESIEWVLRNDQVWSFLVMIFIHSFFVWLDIVRRSRPDQTRSSLGTYFGWDVGLWEGGFFSNSPVFFPCLSSLFGGGDQNDIGTLGDGLILCLSHEPIKGSVKWDFVFAMEMKLFCVSDVVWCGLDSFEMLFFCMY